MPTIRSSHSTGTNHMTHKKTLLFSLTPFAALLLMAASGNLRWDQFRAADKHGTGSYGQSSDGTGASGDIAAFNADGTITDGGAASGLLSGSTNQIGRAHV